MKKIILFSLFVLIYSPYLTSAETISLSTFYPAPFGTYDRIRLVPRDPIGLPCRVGTLYTDNTDFTLRYCAITLALDPDAGVWGPMEGLWRNDTAVPQNVWLIDSESTAMQVGIGTTSPGAELHIYGGNSGAPALQVDRGADGQPFQGLQFWATDRDAYIRYEEDAPETSPGKLHFQTSLSGGSINDALVIDGGGNVGIGTTSPRYQLEIFGPSQLITAITDAGLKGGTLSLLGSSGAAGSGGTILFGNVQSQTSASAGYAAIKGFLTNGGGNTTGHLAFSTRSSTAATALTERMRIQDTTGNIGIGETDPASRLEVAGEFRITSTAPQIRFEDTNAEDFWIHINDNRLYFLWDELDDGDWDPPFPLYLQQRDAFFGGNVTAPVFLYASDGTLKKNIKPVENALDKVQRLKGVEFEWKRNGEKSIGLVGQDVEKVLPELVHTNESDGLKSVQYGNIVAVLVEAVKEQQGQIEQQQRQINEMRKELGI